MFIARACIPFVCCSWLKALKGTISNAPIHGEKSHVNAASVGDIGKVTIISKGEYNQSKRASPIHIIYIDIYYINIFTGKPICYVFFPLLLLLVFLYYIL